MATPSLLPLTTLFPLKRAPELNRDTDEPSTWGFKAQLKAAEREERNNERQASFAVWQCHLYYPSCYRSPLPHLCNNLNM